MTRFDPINATRVGRTECQRNHAVFPKKCILFHVGGINSAILLLTGPEWDKGARLYNYNARWYDPQIGRFLSEDPGGITGGDDPNLYRYVGNDPVNHTDPTGLYQAGNPLNSLFGATPATRSRRSNPSTATGRALRRRSRRYP